MNTKTLLTLAMGTLLTTAQAQLPTMNFGQKRGMWASINANGDVSNGEYKNHNNKLLISWRMLPTDTWDQSFLIYSRPANSVTAILSRTTTATPVAKATCYQVSTVPTSSRVYYLIDGKYFGETTPPISIEDADAKQALREAALDSMALGPHIYQNKLPYISIPLKTTEDVCDVNVIKYQANDATVADLDGDGEMEIIVKRLLTVLNADGTVLSDGTGAGDSDTRTRHCVIWDAYKLDGTFLWRIKSGPNIILGNSSNFAVADLDGDGCAEFITKTGEGTVFGDGYEIPDTDGDNRTDYRSIWPAGHYTGDGPKGYGGPEFFSVCDGKTGKELARANFICRGKEGETPAQLAANWEANDWKWDPRTKKYQWKLANSLRLGVASFTGKGLQIFLGRGVYGRTVVEGWEFTRTAEGNGQLTRMWKIDTDDAGGKDKNKDGKTYSAYAGQGNHAFNVADLDGDGKDEVMYGSCAWDDDGTGLWSSGLGHGDANHVGRFIPDREGLQIFHCLETGKTMVALHNASDGSIIWKKDAASDNDTGRCLIGDFQSQYPGYESYYYQGNIIKADGTETSTNTKGIKGGCAMAIWFDGYLTRQQMEDNIINSMEHGRTFTMWHHGMSSINSTKGNPSWYGDFLGDWREEVIVPDATKLNCLKVFSTWYPTTYKLPYLMSDHTYFMQCIHEQVGYNQPTNVGGYYLGSGMDFTKVPLQDSSELNVKEIESSASARPTDDSNQIFDLSGRAVTNPKSGIYIKNGKKVVVR